MEDNNGALGSSPSINSVLKPPKPRIPLKDLISTAQEEDNTAARKRRVSFANVNRIKEFSAGAESLVVCHTPAYEEPFSSISSDSSCPSGVDGWTPTPATHVHQEILGFEQKENLIVESNPYRASLLPNQCPPDQYFLADGPDYIRRESVEGKPICQVRPSLKFQTPGYFTHDNKTMFSSPSCDSQGDEMEMTSCISFHKAASRHSTRYSSGMDLTSVVGQTLKNTRYSGEGMDLTSVVGQTLKNTRYSGEGMDLTSVVGQTLKNTRYSVEGMDLTEAAITTDLPTNQRSSMTYVNKTNYSDLNNSDELELTDAINSPKVAPMSTMYSMKDMDSTEHLYSVNNTRYSLKGMDLTKGAISRRSSGRRKSTRYSVINMELTTAVGDDCCSDLDLTETVGDENILAISTRRSANEFNLTRGAFSRDHTRCTTTSMDCTDIAGNILDYSADSEMSMDFTKPLPNICISQFNEKSILADSSMELTELMNEDECSKSFSYAADMLSTKNFEEPHKSLFASKTDLPSDPSCEENPSKTNNNIDTEIVLEQKSNAENKQTEKLLNVLKKRDTSSNPGTDRNHEINLISSKPYEISNNSLSKNLFSGNRSKIENNNKPTTLIENNDSNLSSSNEIPKELNIVSQVTSKSIGNEQKVVVQTNFHNDSTEKESNHSFLKFFGSSNKMDLDKNKPTENNSHYTDTEINSINKTQPGLLKTTNNNVSIVLKTETCNSKKENENIAQLTDIGTDKQENNKSNKTMDLPEHHSSDCFPKNRKSINPDRKSLNTGGGKLNFNELEEKCDELEKEMSNMSVFTLDKSGVNDSNMLAKVDKENHVSMNYTKQKFQKDYENIDVSIIDNVDINIDCEMQKNEIMESNTPFTSNTDNIETEDYGYKLMEENINLYDPCKILKTTIGAHDVCKELKEMDNQEEVCTKIVETNSMDNKTTIDVHDVCKELKEIDNQEEVCTKIVETNNMDNVFQQEKERNCDCDSYQSVKTTNVAHDSCKIVKEIVETNNMDNVFQQEKERNCEGNSYKSVKTTNVAHDACKMVKDFDNSQNICTLIEETDSVGEYCKVVQNNIVAFDTCKVDVQTDNINGKLLKELDNDLGYDAEKNICHEQANLSLINDECEKDKSGIGLIHNESIIKNCSSPMNCSSNDTVCSKNITMTRGGTRKGRPSTTCLVLQNQVAGSRDDSLMTSHVEQTSVLESLPLIQRIAMKQKNTLDSSESYSAISHSPDSVFRRSEKGGKRSFEEALEPENETEESPVKQFCSERTDFDLLSNITAPSILMETISVPNDTIPSLQPRENLSPCISMNRSPQIQSCVDMKHGPQFSSEENQVNVRNKVSEERLGLDHNYDHSFSLRVDISSEFEISKSSTRLDNMSHMNLEIKNRISLSGKRKESRASLKKTNEYKQTDLNRTPRKEPILFSEEESVSEIDDLFSSPLAKRTFKNSQDAENPDSPAFFNSTLDVNVGKREASTAQTVRESSEKCTHPFGSNERFKVVSEGVFVCNLIPEWIGLEFSVDSSDNVIHPAYHLVCSESDRAVGEYLLCQVKIHMSLEQASSLVLQLQQPWLGFLQRLAKNLNLIIKFFNGQLRGNILTIEVIGYSDQFWTFVDVNMKYPQYLSAHDITVSEQRIGVLKLAHVRQIFENSSKQLLDFAIALDKL